MTTPPLVTKYQKRISGPLLDRIDIHIEVLRVDYEKLSGDRVVEASECIRARLRLLLDESTLTAALAKRLECAQEP